MTDPRDAEVVGNGVCIIPKVIYLVPTTKWKYVTNLILSLIFCLFLSIKYVPTYNTIFEKIILVILIFSVILVITYHSIEYILNGKAIGTLDPSGRVYKGFWAFFNFLVWSFLPALIIYKTFFM